MFFTDSVDISPCPSKDDTTDDGPTYQFFDLASNATMYTPCVRPAVSLRFGFAVAGGTLLLLNVTGCRAIIRDNREQSEQKMAAMARRRPGGSGDSAEDDIAAIAKQISDTAEVIYQNWKSRNLTPAELISCHGAGDTAKLGQVPTNILISSAIH
ncbi:hypothetical protein GWI33_002591 [Rhynchophorus ferrugineus]|uniref:Uncharacterized protein n=1 Tax=Rhynchophorus ferrugineus TaxID=354439 RepID=A0A834IMU1_RHYFE|nr:hypothetical protein GWI33_002591 [Rhynchophorus ferrugineus]